MPKAAKGFDYERKFAKKLSLWWSNNQREDIFWRVGGSGGRATVRGRSNRDTANGYGDINAQCKEAQNLLDVVTFELKRGYNDVTLSDLFEKPDKPGKLLEFMEQAASAASLAGTPGWVLVHKRDRREAIYYVCLDSLPVTLGLGFARVWAGGKVQRGVAVLCDDEFFDSQVLRHVFLAEADRIQGKK